MQSVQLILILYMSNSYPRTLWTGELPPPTAEVTNQTLYCSCFDNKYVSFKSFFHNQSYVNINSVDLSLHKFTPTAQLITQVMNIEYLFTRTCIQSNKYPVAVSTRLNSRV